ncbi:hypothetical protein MP228_003027 [Amoeboaphelidium protococcarum]|nr:hypothetical protein MP228_003027 [Amoeboaphelidium protococcarum]
MDGQVVGVAELITDDPQFMRGHGTYVGQSELDQQQSSSSASTVFSSLAGQIQRVNKLVSVVPINQRFTPQIGDVVVGRIKDVGSKKWRVDINAKQDAILLLSSVTLPGGAQRRRLESDELQMRSFFSEGDLIVAEVQQLFHDGAVSLHTRSLKYGKLKNGTMLQVSSALIERSKQHFIQLKNLRHTNNDTGECDIDVVLGVNGNVFICPHVESLNLEDVEQNPDLLYTNIPQRSPTVMERLVIAKIKNIIQVLSMLRYKITEETVKQCFEYLQTYNAADILNTQTRNLIQDYLRQLNSS